MTKTYAAPLALIAWPIDERDLVSFSEDMFSRLQKR